MSEADVKDIELVINHLRRQRDTLLKQKPIQPKGVTDHAVLRYLERVKGIDMDAVREEILAKDNHGALKAGAVRIRTKDCELVCANGYVVTVIA